MYPRGRKLRIELYQAEIYEPVKRRLAANTAVDIAILISACVPYIWHTK